MVYHASLSSFGPSLPSDFSSYRSLPFASQCDRTLRSIRFQRFILNGQRLEYDVSMYEDLDNSVLHGLPLPAGACCCLLTGWARHIEPRKQVFKLLVRTNAHKSVHFTGKGMYQALLVRSNDQSAPLYLRIEAVQCLAQHEDLFPMYWEGGNFVCVAFDTPPVRWYEEKEFQEFLEMCVELCLGSSTRDLWLNEMKDVVVEAGSGDGGGGGVVVDTKCGCVLQSVIREGQAVSLHRLLSIVPMLELDVFCYATTACELCSSSSNTAAMMAAAEDSCCNRHRWYSAEEWAKQTKGNRYVVSWLIKCARYKMHERNELVRKQLQERTTPVVICNLIESYLWNFDMNSLPPYQSSADAFPTSSQIFEGISSGTMIDHGAVSWLINCRSTILCPREKSSLLNCILSLPSTLQTKSLQAVVSSLITRTVYSSDAGKWLNQVVEVEGKCTNPLFSALQNNSEAAYELLKTGLVELDVFYFPVGADCIHCEAKRGQKKHRRGKQYRGGKKHRGEKTCLKHRWLSAEEFVPNFVPGNQSKGMDQCIADIIAGYRGAIENQRERRSSCIRVLCAHRKLPFRSDVCEIIDSYGARPCAVQVRIVS